MLSTLVVDASRAEPVRAAALDALARYRGRDVLSARLTVLYDPKAPDTLIARALPALARDGIIPANDVAGFLEHASPTVRAAALLSLNVKKGLSPEIILAVLARLDDQSVEVRQAAVMAVGALRLREGIPKLIELGSKFDAELRPQAIAALCLMPDPRAAAVYKQAANEEDPSLSRAAEQALAVVGGQADAQLVRASVTNVESLRQFALGHSGDPRKGETLFSENRSMGCSQCHSIGGRGQTTLGPDLTGVGLKYDKAGLIRSVLEPLPKMASSGNAPEGSHRDRHPAGLFDHVTPLEFTDVITFLGGLKSPAAGHSLR
jgi:hypothetical protein